MENYLKQFKKGVLELVVLKVLQAQPMYGYQIAGEISTRHPALGLKEGTLYPILYRLEDEGLVRAQWEEQAARGVPKKYYAITEKGKVTLESASRQWLEFARSVTDILEG